MKKFDQDRADLEAFLRGDAKAAKMLISRYSTPLLNHACYLLRGDQALAEDFVQNSFMQLWRNAGALLEKDQPLYLRAWLFRVLRNQCLDHFRKPEFQSDEGMDWADEKPSAEEGLQAEERAHFVMGLIGRLPERQKSALLLRHFEDMSQAEIADVLDCTVEAVENLLARARRSLRKWASDQETML